MPDSLLLYKPANAASPVGASEVQRTPDTQKSVQVTATGPTAIWTPAAGKRFRLMELIIQLTANAGVAAGAVVTLTLLDTAAATGLVFDFFVPTTPITTQPGDAVCVPIPLPRNGLVSATLNGVLNATLSVALTSGNFRIIAIGCEELV